MATKLFTSNEKYSVPLSTLDLAVVPSSSYLASRLYGYAAGAALSAGAGVWQTLLDVTGEGILSGAVVAMASGTETISLRITIDGVAYSLACGTSSAPKSVFVAGPVTKDDTSTYSIGPSPIGFPFDSSLKIEAMRSGTQTAAAHWTHAMKVS